MWQYNYIVINATIIQMWDCHKSTETRIIYSSRWCMQECCIIYIYIWQWALASMFIYRSSDSRVYTVPLSWFTMLSSSLLLLSPFWGSSVTTSVDHWRMIQGPRQWPMSSSAMRNHYCALVQLVNILYFLMSELPNIATPSSYSITET